MSTPASKGARFQIMEFIVPYGSDRGRWAVIVSPGDFPVVVSRHADMQSAADEANRLNKD